MGVALMTWDKFKTFLRKSLRESNAFVSHVSSKLRGDAQHQVEELQDWAVHLEHFQSILQEFDTNNASRGSQLSQTFHDGLRPLIKLWIANKREDMPWDDLIKAANKAEARAKIQENTPLDQRRPKGKQLLKMSLNARDDQAKRWMPHYRRPRLAHGVWPINDHREGQREGQERKEKKEVSKKMRQTRKTRR